MLECLTSELQSPANGGFYTRVFNFSFALLIAPTGTPPAQTPASPSCIHGDAEKPASNAGFSEGFTPQSPQTGGLLLFLVAAPHSQPSPDSPQNRPSPRCWSLGHFISRLRMGPGSPGHVPGLVTTEERTLGGDGPCPATFVTPAPHHPPLAVTVGRVQCSPWCETPSWFSAV